MLNSNIKTVALSKTENEKIIGQIVGESKNYDQNSDRVSRNDKSCNICSLRQKGLIVKYGKHGTLSIFYVSSIYGTSFILFSSIDLKRMVDRRCLCFLRSVFERPSSPSSPNS